MCGREKGIHPAHVRESRNCNDNSGAIMSRFAQCIFIVAGGIPRFPLRGQVGMIDPGCETISVLYVSVCHRHHHAGPLE